MEGVADSGEREEEAVVERQWSQWRLTGRGGICWEERESCIDWVHHVCGGVLRKYCRPGDTTWAATTAMSTQRCGSWCSGRWCTFWKTLATRAGIAIHHVPRPHLPTQCTTKVSQGTLLYLWSWWEDLAISCCINTSHSENRTTYCEFVYMYYYVHVHNLSIT